MGSASTAATVSSCPLRQCTCTLVRMSHTRQAARGEGLCVWMGGMVRGCGEPWCVRMSRTRQAARGGREEGARCRGVPRGESVVCMRTRGPARWQANAALHRVRPSSNSAVFNDPADPPTCVAAAGHDDVHCWVLRQAVHARQVAVVVADDLARQGRGWGERRRGWGR